MCARKIAAFEPPSSRPGLFFTGLCRNPFVAPQIADLIFL